MSNYELLIQKLDEFIRKYYKNRIIQGILISVGLVLSVFLVIATFEFFGHFGSSVRAVMFFTFAALFLSVFGYYIAYPVLQLLKYGKHISHEQAAKIIGNFFPDVKDKLINVLQLNALNEKENSPLVIAGLNQKIEEITPVKFTTAIDFGSNKKYLPYAIPPLLIFLFLLVYSPSFITKSAERIVKYSKYFKPEAPFDFLLANKKLEVIQGEDLDIELKLDGNILPSRAYLSVSGNKYAMQGDFKKGFNYNLKNLQKNTTFSFFADDFFSDEYEIVVLPKPLITNFEVVLEYPKYTLKEDEVLKNIGDIKVPVGTNIKWKFNAQNTNSLFFKLSDKVLTAIKPNEKQFIVSAKAMQSEMYSITTSNARVNSKDTVSYVLTVIDDQFPNIRMEQQADSSQSTVFYFAGEISDDYGFSELYFVYQQKGSNKSIKQKLNINARTLSQSVFHYVDFEKLSLKPGDAVDYFFEVWDNDRVHGAKSARSSLLSWKIPSLEEMEAKSDADTKKVKEALTESLKEIKNLKKETEKLAQKLNNQNEISWQDKKSMDELLKKQQSLMNQLNESKDLLKKSNQMKDKFSNIDPALLEKQKQIQEMFDKLINDDLKKLMEELQKLAMKNNKEEINKQVEDMKLSNKDIEKELDRMLEFMKQAEFEEKFNKTAEELKQLAKEQEDLAKKTEDKKENNEELKKQQEEINKKFDALDKKMEDLEKQNKELEKPNQLDDLNNESQDIKKDQKESVEDLNQKKNSKASDKQQKAANKMQRMAERMQSMMASGEAKEMGEDMQKLRMLLENLLKLSFKQERLMEDLNQHPTYSPSYIRIAQDQSKIKEDAKLIEDSIFALSKRIIAIQSFVNKEIGEINLNLERSIAELAERNTGGARMRQQYVMTGVNNLALMLSESLKQMQQQMASQMKGEQNCQKPGQGKPSKGKGNSMGNLRQLQEELNKQMEQMQKGQKPGQGKEGENGKMNMGGMSSSDFAKSVAKQEAIRREMQKLNEQLNKDGKGSLGDLDKLAKEMEKTEEELVNKRFTPETMRRQQDILTRLLESEKAERERELDEKRESNSADQNLKNNSKSFEEYKRKKEKELELFKTLSPELNNYYKRKVEEYFIKINN